MIRKREKRDTGARDKVAKKCARVCMYKENRGCEKGCARKTGMVSLRWKDETPLLRNVKTFMKNGTNLRKCENKLLNYII